MRTQAGAGGRWEGARRREGKGRPSVPRRSEHPRSRARSRPATAPAPCIPEAGAARTLQRADRRVASLLRRVTCEALWLRSQRQLLPLALRARAGAAAEP